MPTRPPRVYIQRFNTTQVRVEAPATSRRARDGELFFDPETRTLRLGNGVAAGGVILAGPSGDVSSQLVAEEATFTLQANGDVVLEGTIRDAEGNDLLAGGGTDTADFAFDTTSNRSTLYMGTNGANATMSLSPSGVEGSAYVEIPGDNNTGNGLNIYNTGTNGRIYARAQELVEFESNNSDILLGTDGGLWRFRKDGLLEFPNGSKQRTAAYPAGSVTFESITYVDDFADPIAAGMTDLQLELNEYNQDDERYFLELPFNIKSFGRTINAITLSSNAYIDFETAVEAAGYIPQVGPNGPKYLIDAENVPLLCIFGRDGGWQKVYTKQLTNPNRFVVRFEGDPTHAGYQAPSTLKYNIVFYENSDQMDLYIVDNSGGFPSLAFISDSWTNLSEFGNSQGNAYTIRTSPYLYDADGNITLSGGARISTAGYNSDSLVANVFAKGDQYAGLDWKGTNTVYAGPSGIDVYTNSSGTAYEEGSENLWNFGAGGNLSLPNGNVIGGGEIPVVVSNATSITSYAYDATGTTVMMESGDTVDFPNFSGIVTVTCYASGVLSQYLCGSGDTPQRIGSSRAASHTGAMTANGGIGGYTFSASETGEHCFYVVRTRTGA